MRLGFVVGAGWAVLVLSGAWRTRPAPGRVVALGPPLERPSLRLGARGRRWSLALVCGFAGLLVLPLAAPVLALVGWAAPVVRHRRAAARPRELVRRSLPEAVDLLALAVGAGLTVPLAVAAVADRLTGPVGDELRRVTDEVGRGRPCADALDAAAHRLGPEARPVLAALAASERYGAPLADALAVQAAEVRADRRRRADAAARRVPVRLLFPLVLCVLPAFGLLTVAPLLAGAFGSLRP